MSEMCTYVDIIIYMTAIFICYEIRVYISFLWHYKRDNKNVKQAKDSDLTLFVPTLDDVLNNTSNHYFV